MVPHGIRHHQKPGHSPKRRKHSVLIVLLVVKLS
jgi:hypothetical protein